MALTEEQQARIVALRAAGMSYARIAEEVQCAKATAVRYGAQAAAQICDQRKELLEEVLSAQRLLLRDRLNALAELAQRIVAELGKRDMATVSTVGLARLYIEVLRAVQEQRPVAGDAEVERLQPAPVPTLEEVLANLPHGNRK